MIVFLQIGSQRLKVIIIIIDDVPFLSLCLYVYTDTNKVCLGIKKNLRSLPSELYKRPGECNKV